MLFFPVSKGHSEFKLLRQRHETYSEKTGVDRDCFYVNSSKKHCVPTQEYGISARLGQKRGADFSLNSFLVSCNTQLLCANDERSEANWAGTHGGWQTPQPSDVYSSQGQLFPLRHQLPTSNEVKSGLTETD